MLFIYKRTTGTESPLSNNFLNCSLPTLRNASSLVDFVAFFWIFEKSALSFIASELFYHTLSRVVNPIALYRLKTYRPRVKDQQISLLFQSN